MTPTHFIVWDLDLTLGDFSALHGVEAHGGPVSLKVRPGLADTLRALTEAGFAHTILTLASPLYAETALRGTGLREFFVQVEGMGQRDKGDAAGIAQALGIPEKERPDRVLFVGDHPLFDLPRDPRILFHLEPFALARPAAELQRLVLHLRETGQGSLRRGFDRLAAQRIGWRRLWPFPVRPARGQSLRRSPPGIGELLLLVSQECCPMIGFEKPPQPGMSPEVHQIEPLEIIAQVKAEQEKTRGMGSPAAETMLE